MSHERLVGKTISVVVIAIAVMMMGLSSEPLNAVQPQAVMLAQPILEPTPAMTNTEDKSRAEIECLAKNIYFESRGEPLAGKIAVGLVTLNRAREASFPDTVCGVVSQRHQFSWMWDKIPDKIAQPDVYDEIYTLSELLYDQYHVNKRFPDIVDGATHFHTGAVNPQWRGKKLVVKIGNHAFFTVRDRG